jgi:peptidase E
MIKPPKAVIAGAVIAGLDIETNMKLSSLISKSHHSFASVLLAFSLFGFLFPHQTKQVKPNHQVNLRTSEPATDREPADDGSDYEWFY